MVDKVKTTKPLMNEQSDGPLGMGIPPIGTGRPCFWRSSGLVDRQRIPHQEPGTTVERGRVPQILGADLDKEVLTSMHQLHIG